MGSRRAFAMPGLVLALVLALVLSAGIARADSRIRLDVSSQTQYPSVFAGLEVSLVFDPNAAPTADNGLNYRDWAIEQLELCGQTVSDPGFIASVYIPSLGYSQIILPPLPVTIGGDRVLNISGLRVNMVYGDPWPADNSAANWPTPQEVTFNLPGSQTCWNTYTGFNEVGGTLTVTYLPVPPIHADGFENLTLGETWSNAFSEGAGEPRVVAAYSETVW